MKLRRRRLEVEAADAPAVTTACRAPSTSMYLDQFGDVRACCMNILHPLGNITTARLEDIWHGERARALRDAVAEKDFSLGCRFCEAPVFDGREDLAFARWFDRFEMTEGQLDWPRQIEFSITNTCNLQCVMCNGDWSSSIRSQREGREPLPSVYGEDFFADLDAFLPHLEMVKFLGGEPFLATETLRIMDRLVTLGLTPTCHITTNGTHWTPRVQRILDTLPVDIAVSLDAATGPTYESIRIGSDWDTVMANIERFRAHAQRTGAILDLTFCLMRMNWQELGAFCELADQLDVGATVNTVTQPAEVSLYHLAEPELAEVLGALEAQDDAMRATLQRNLSTWEGELTRLRARLDELRWDPDDVSTRMPLHVRVGPDVVHHERDEARAADLADWRKHHLAADAAEIRLSVRSRVTDVRPGGPLPDLGDVVQPGSGSGDLLDLIRSTTPGVGDPADMDERHGCLALRVPVEGQPDWAVLVEPILDDEGYERGTTVSISSTAAIGV